jgi:hypothetical protein
MIDSRPLAKSLCLTAFQYLGMTVTQDRSKRSIAIDQFGYINRVLD